MNILITGGCGYIGNKLLDLYIDSALINYNITVLDNRFIPQIIIRSKENDRRIKIIQGDIRDKELVKKLVKDKDIIYHLASKTGTKSNPKSEQEVNDINVNGSKNIIETMPKECKFIFASTGNVFGGKDIINTTEKDEPKPLFVYAKTKVAIENYLKEKNCNYVICRFGANYGYGNEMRMNLVGNIFAKLTAQNGTIKLYGGGNNIRPLTYVGDSARVLKHLGENPLFNKEIFHCNGENKTIKEIAETCKGINKKIKIKKTNDEVPFGSYGMDNKKLLRTGFKFESNIEKEIKNMYEMWRS